MEPFLVSTLVVALAEIGDRTQILAIVLVSRFHKPWPIIAGILVATLANHALAATAGYFVADWLKGMWFQYVLAAAFFATAIWTLIPDKEDEAKAGAGHLSVFLTTVVTFFLVEMGDKTQIAAIALAAKFHNILLVTAGTTLGMMIANVPAVFLGRAATKIVPLAYVRFGAAVMFVGLGIWTMVAALGG